MRLTRKNLFKSKAQGMVEFAIILPVLLLVVYGLIEVSRYIFVYASVHTATREAVRYGSATGLGTGGILQYKDCAGIMNAAQSVDFLDVIDNENINITYVRGPSMTVFSGCPPPDPEDMLTGDRIVVTVTATIEPLVPIIPMGEITIPSTSRRTILVEVPIWDADAGGGTGGGGGSGGGGGGGAEGCGDEICQEDETCDTCEEDCGSCAPHCGDEICQPEINETCVSCQIDCGTCPEPPGTYCGDMTCQAESGETCATCPPDCGICCPNGICDATENCTLCSSDCGLCCPNSVCDAGETCVTCAADCGACCPNSVCGAGETCNNCPADCGVCSCNITDSGPLVPGSQSTWTLNNRDTTAHYINTITVYWDSSANRSLDKIYLNAVNILPSAKLTSPYTMSGGLWIIKPGYNPFLLIFSRSTTNIRMVVTFVAEDTLCLPIDSSQ